MKTYARSDIASIAISPDHGGCGQTHSPSEDRTVDCEQCGPILVRDHGFGWTRDEAEKTYDETVEARKLEQEGTIATQQMASALGKQAARMVAGDSDEVAALREENKLLRDQIAEVLTELRKKDSPVRRSPSAKPKVKAS